MIRPIMKDIFFLNQRSEPATEADKQVAVDLLDTLKAHEEGCVGMAANMIGVKKCTRYQEIEVEYQDMNFKKQRQKYTGWTAQIIQHEVDHCHGIVI